MVANKLTEQRVYLSVTYLVYISLSDYENQLTVLLHHSAVLQDTLHLHSDFLAPGGPGSAWGLGLQHLLPQESVVWTSRK